MIQLAGLTFHWYGLLIGLSVIVGLQLVQFQARRYDISETELEKALLWGIIGGIIGARIYHVITEFSLYQSNLLDILYVWQGGLSIIGAVIGGLLGLLIAARLRIVTVPLLMLFDISVFGLPVAQAIGRLGNWINQELYGFPTDLPWAIAIDLEHRSPGFEKFSHFHPLFLYEMLANVVFAGWVWWRSYQPDGRLKTWSVGSGRYFASYVLYYSFVRFWLDYLRIEKTASGWGNIGLNQLILLIIFLVTLVWYRLKWLTQAKIVGV